MTVIDFILLLNASSSVLLSPNTARAENVSRVFFIINEVGWPWDILCAFIAKLLRNCFHFIAKCVKSAQHMDVSLLSVEIEMFLG